MLQLVRNEKNLLIAILQAFRWTVAFLKKRRKKKSDKRRANRYCLNRLRPSRKGIFRANLPLRQKIRLAPRHRIRLHSRNHSPRVQPMTTVRKVADQTVQRALPAHPFGQPLQPAPLPGGGPHLDRGQASLDANWRRFARLSQEHRLAGI